MIITIISQNNLYFACLLLFYCAKHLSLSTFIMCSSEISEILVDN